MFDNVKAGQKISDLRKSMNLTQDEQVHLSTPSSTFCTIDEVKHLTLHTVLSKSKTRIFPNVDQFARQ